MPPKKRKLWATRTTPTMPYARHASQKAAYEEVRSLAGQFRAGGLRPGVTHVTVFVDGQDGRGWRRFERLSLADLTRHDAPEGKE